MNGYFQGKKVLVTGGTGFVGSHFVSVLHGLGAVLRVTVHETKPSIIPDIEYIQAELTRPDDCKRACSGMDIVIHAAGSVGSAGISSHRKLSGICDNLVMMVRTLEAAVSEDAKQFLLFSSSTTYPGGDRAFREEDMWDGDVPQTYFGYGWMRRYFELFSGFSGQISNLKIGICRPTAIYGPGDNFSLDNSHVLAALIRRAVEGQNPLIVWGDGKEIRDFLHVRDLVSGGLLILSHRLAHNEPVNIGSGIPVTIGQLAEMILDVADRKGDPMRFDASKPVTVPVRRVDVSKALNRLGFRPSVSLRQGLLETLSWYKMKHKVPA